MRLRQSVLYRIYLVNSHTCKSTKPVTMSTHMGSPLFQLISLVLCLFLPTLLPSVDAALDTCSGVKNVYTQSGCCGQSDTQSLDISTLFPTGNSGVEPTCGGLRELFQDQSCCPEPIQYEPIWCDATNCTYLGSPTETPTTDPTGMTFANGNCSGTMTVHHYLTVDEQQEQPDDFPYSVVPEASGTFQLPHSTADVLLTLLWVKADECSTALPVARSYAGYPWEGIMPVPVFPECNDSTGNCLINLDSSALPTQISIVTGAFVIQMRQRQGKSVTEAEAVARLMIQGTFGVTKTEIDAVLDNFGPGASNSDDISNDTDASAAAAWFAAEVEKPPTYLRQRYRLNTNPRMYPNGDYAGGEEYGRCEVGSRWHRYVLCSIPLTATLLCWHLILHVPAVIYVCTFRYAFNYLRLHFQVCF